MARRRDHCSMPGGFQGPRRLARQTTVEALAHAKTRRTATKAKQHKSRRVVQMRVKQLVYVAGMTIALATAAAASAQPTADEILDQVESKGIMGGLAGTMTADVRFQVAVGQTDETTYAFRIYSSMDVANEPDKLLIVYREPELVAGTIFLTYTPEAGDSRMWLYLPALGGVKELVSKESRSEEFVAGSGVSRNDIANGFQYKKDYTPTIAGEEEIEGLPAYVLVLTPREGRSPDWSTIKLWVHRDEYVVIRAEFTDREGRLAKTIAGGDFFTDSMGFSFHTLLFQDLIDNESSRITLQSRSAVDVPSTFFLPESLATLQY